MSVRCAGWISGRGIAASACSVCRSEVRQVNRGKAGIYPICVFCADVSSSFLLTWTSLFGVAGLRTKCSFPIGVNKSRAYDVRRWWRCWRGSGHGSGAPDSDTEGQLLLLRKGERRSQAVLALQASLLLRSRVPERGVEEAHEEVRAAAVCGRCL
jgi:hypothetical protein